MRRFLLAVVTLQVALGMLGGCKKASSGQAADQPGRDAPPEVARPSVEAPLAPATGPVVFMDLLAQAQGVVFVCDASGPMVAHFDQVISALKKSIAALRPSQSFNVVFSQGGGDSPLSWELLPASPFNKRRISRWIDQRPPHGHAAPQTALKTAFAMKPQLIYFVCAGDSWTDPEETIAAVRKLQAEGRVKIDTIAFRHGPGEDVLTQIAQESNGAFRYMGEEDQTKESRTPTAQP